VTALTSIVLGFLLSSSLHSDIEEAVLRADATKLQTLLRAQPAEITKAALRSSSAPTGYTVLHAAASSSFADKCALIKPLVEHGADVNAATPSGDTPLLLAVVLGHRSCVVALLAAGANPNQVGSHDVSPLDAAATRGDVEIVALLLARGADPKHKAAAGSSSVDLATSPAVVTFLALCGADTSARHANAKKARDTDMLGALARADALRKSGARCESAALIPTKLAASPAKGWWTRKDACPAGTSLETSNNVVRCTCGGASHGPYSELYGPAAAKDEGERAVLVSGTYVLHRRHGAWTTYDQSGAVVDEDVYVEGALIRNVRKKDAIVPPSMPDVWLSSAEMDFARASCPATE
jgi:hypothetical protein